MLTWLRIVVSCVCLVLCVLFAALWVRSYYYGDFVQKTFRVSPRTSYNLTIATSGKGSISLHLGVQSGPNIKFVNWRFDSESTAEYTPEGHWLNFVWLTLRYEYRNVRHILFPHWFAILIFGFTAYLVKPKPRWQFGMRELFVLSTIGAITVGTLAAVLRAISP